MKNAIPKPAVLAIVLWGLTGCGGEMEPRTEEHLSETTPPNIILMIGDGMGVPQVSVAYYFGDGEANFSKFKHIGFHKTSDVTHKITDSAAGATAFAIGQKTYKRAIGVAADSAPQETIMEYLRRRGYAAGLVSLTTITHATPAAFYAHVPDRDLHEEIAAQLAAAKVDFFAGGGRNFFGKRTDGRNLYDSLLQNGYHLDTVALSAPDYERPNAYVLADESLPSTVQGRTDFLPRATQMALDYLGRKEAPFFLMVEGSYIDWAGHAEDAEMLKGEVEDFDQTLGVVLAFMDRHPNTLLVVTADHETGEVSIGKKYEIDPASGDQREVPQEVSINFNSNQHSGELIPVFAMGPGAEAFQGIYENSDIYHKLKAAYQAAE